MDLNLTPNEQEFRDEFRAWLDTNVPAEWTSGVSTGSEDNDAYIQYLHDWQRKLYEGGWAGISWPKEYGGRGATLMEQSIFQAELALLVLLYYLGGGALVDPDVSEISVKAGSIETARGREFWYSRRVSTLMPMQIN